VAILACLVVLCTRKELKMNEKLCSGFGQNQTDKYGKPLISITLAEIFDMAERPQQVIKMDSQWFIPSTLQTRSGDSQKKYGQYYAAWVDIDCHTEVDAIKAVLAELSVLNGRKFDWLIYSSSSAKKDYQKWRVIIPFAEPATATQWRYVSEIINQKFGDAGIQCDWRSALPSQICYLPNKGDFYEYHENYNPLVKGMSLDWKNAFASEIAKKLELENIEKERVKVNQEQSRIKAMQRLQSDIKSPVDAFNAAYTVQQLADSYGFKHVGNNRYLSPNSESGQAGFCIDGNRWISSHGSDSQMGKTCKGGVRGDAFDLFVFFENGNDYDRAVIAAGEMFEVDGVTITKSNQREHMARKDDALDGQAAVAFIESIKNKNQSEAVSKVSLVSKLENESNEWEQPLEIVSELLPVQEFDCDLLPIPLREFVKDNAHRMQTPPDFCAISTLVIISSIIGAGCGVRPKQLDDWEVIPNLWGACVGAPSMLKTPSMKEPLKLLERLQAEYSKTFEAQKMDADFDALTLDAAKNTIEKRIKKEVEKKGGNVNALKSEFAELMQSAPVEMARRIFKTNETSVQSMTVLQNQNPKGLLVFRDEIMGLLSTWDRDDKADERAYFLEGWNGNGSYTDFKLNRGLTDAKNICISLLGSIQPDKLNRYLMQARKGSNDGLVQRFQLAVYPNELAQWQYNDIKPNRDEKNRVFEILEKLCELDFSKYGSH
jgi:hypothetical protein